MNLLRTFSITLPILIPGLFLIFSIKINLLGFFNYPVDFGITFKKKPVLGKNKTFRGLFIYSILSIFTCFTLNIYSVRLEWLIHPIFKNNFWQTGLLYFLGYSTGEFINSFIKRRLNIPIGKLVKNNYKYFQYLTDTIDGITVVALLLTVFFPQFVQEIIFALVLGILIHISTDLLMQKLKLKKVF